MELIYWVSCQRMTPENMECSNGTIAYSTKLYTTPNNNETCDVEWETKKGGFKRN